MDNKTNIKVKDVTRLYSGEATVVLKQNGLTYNVIKQHNAGTTEFFNFILNCIMGNVIPNKRPAYLYIYSNMNSAPVINFPILYEGAEVTTVGSTGVSSCDFTFLVPNSILPETQLAGFKINRLDSTDYTNKIYAVVEFDSPISIAQNTNLYITWHLEIGNKDSEAEVEEV